MASDESKTQILRRCGKMAMISDAILGKNRLDGLCLKREYFKCCIVHHRWIYNAWYGWWRIVFSEILPVDVAESIIVSEYFISVDVADSVLFIMNIDSTRTQEKFITMLNCVGFLWIYLLFHWISLQLYLKHMLVD